MNATLPVAPPANAAPAPGAASPAGSPPAAADPAAAPAALSTASLSASIVSQLTGAKPAATPAAGPEPSPAAGQPESIVNPAPAPAPGTDPTPAPDDDDENLPPPAAFPKEAVAALAMQRKQKKELKAQLKTLTEEIGAIKAELAKVTPKPPGAPEVPPAPEAAPTVAALATPELTAAQEAVTSQEELRNWSRKEIRALNHAIENESDATALLANLQAQVSKFGVTLPGDAAGALAWLDKVQTESTDKLEEARFELRYLQREAEQQHQVQRSEGETFARAVAPKMFEAGTEEAKRFELIKQKIPGLDRHPLGMRFISAAVRGWEVIKGELDRQGAGAHGANGTPAKPNGAPAAPVALPARPAAQLPGVPAVIPGRPAEGPENSSSLFAKYKAALANPQATEQEREAAKQAWVRAGLNGQ